MSVIVTDATFDQLVLAAEKPVLLDFWADWCAPCQMVSPVIEELCSEFADSAIIAKINAEHNPDTAKRYGIRNIPALLFFRNGEVIERHIGAAPKTILAEKLGRHLPCLNEPQV